MADVNNSAFSSFMDDLGGISDALRPLKTRVNSLVARAALSEFVAIVAASSSDDVIVRIRSDAESLPVLKMSNYNDLVYALGLLKNTLDAITPATLEVFTPRAAS